MVIRRLYWHKSARHAGPQAAAARTPVCVPLPRGPHTHTGVRGWVDPGRRALTDCAQPALAGLSRPAQSLGLVALQRDLMAGGEPALRARAMAGGTFA